MEFKGTKESWFLSDDKKSVKSKHGTVATCWSESNEDLDERLDGESWLSMRERTRDERLIRNEIKPKANALLISKSPEMLEMLEKIYKEGKFIKSEIEQLIKQATEL